MNRDRECDVSLNRIPIFPLNAHVFPGGKLKLRLFEQKYLRMVSENSSCSPSFAMAMRSASGQLARQESTELAANDILPLATLVDIVDFEQLDDGLLGITVEGKELVELSNITKDSRGLYLAQCNKITSWQLPVKDTKQILKQNFKLLLAEYQELDELYKQTLTSAEPDELWFLARWLELLPLPARQKMELICQPSPQTAFRQIETLLKQM
jgi:Lon protease-like protein